MKLPLRWQVLWAPLVAFVVVALLIAVEINDRVLWLRRFTDVSRLRDRVEPTLTRIEDRHARTIRRANEAVLDPRRSTRGAILDGVSSHYLREMETHVAQARKAVSTLRSPDSTPKWVSDLQRLDTQIDRILEQSRLVAPHFDALLAATSTDDAEALQSAAQELERTDRTMHALLHTTQAALRRLEAWQARQVLEAPPTIPRVAWVLAGLWALFSVFLAQRPLGRLTQLARGESAGKALSPEETTLDQRMAALTEKNEALGRELTERIREMQRAQSVTRRTEQELALLKLYNDNLVNSLRAAIVVTNTQLVVQSANRAARLLLRVDPSATDSSFTAQPLFASLVQRSESARADLMRALHERQPLRYESLPFAADNDRDVLLDLVVTPYMDESGVPRGLLFVADDVTDAVQTKNQLLATERLAAVGRLSAQVAHEIRNPLSAIGLNAELLSDDFVADLSEPRRSEATKLLGSIANEVARLSDVTEGYLQLTKLPGPNLSTLDINQVVSDLVSILRQEMRTHAVQVELNLASPAPLAAADPGQLRQALLNVLRNSREAMPNGGTIRITTARAGTNVEIAVCDQGPGFTEEALRRVFEPFFSTKAAGTGLGLSLTHQIMQTHGGEVGVSNDVNGGAKLTLKLPQAATVKS